MIIDLDSASSQELQELRNIGPHSANAIVNNRPLSSWEDLHRCAPKLTKRDVLVWHQRGIVTSSIPEFQKVATMGLNDIVVNMFDPLGNKLSSGLHDRQAQAPLLSGAHQTTHSFSPTGPGAHQTYHPLGPSLSGAYQTYPPAPSMSGAHQAPNFSPGAYQAPQYPLSGAYQAYPPKPSVNDDPNAPLGAHFDSLYYPDVDNRDPVSRPNNDGWGGARPKQSPDEHRQTKDEPYDTGSDDLDTTQRGLLAIVDGLHKLGETLCNQALEQRRAQEKFFKCQQRFFDSMEDRSKERALEERAKYQEIIEQERGRQEDLYKRMSTTLSDMKTATVTGFESTVTKQLESAVTKQLDSMRTEVMSAVANQPKTGETLMENKPAMSQAMPQQHKPKSMASPSVPQQTELQETPLDGLRHVYPAGDIYQQHQNQSTSCAGEGYQQHQRQSTPHREHHLSRRSFVGTPRRSHSHHSTTIGGNEPHGRKKLQSNLIENFEGKGMFWEGWKKNFKFVADACEWDDEDRLLMLRTHLRGGALSAVQNLTDDVLGDWEAILNTLDARYGSSKPSTKNRLRAELQAIKQKDEEELEAFADRVFALAVNAHPDYVRDTDLQSYAVDAFLNGCKDRNAGFLAGVVPPRSITDAVDQVKAIQVSSSRTGTKLISRQVSFDDQPAAAVVRQASVSPGRCYSCNGTGHKARDCANKRRRSPSPFRCYECNGIGHIAAECANRLRRPDRSDSRDRDGDRQASNNNYGERRRYYSPGPRREESQYYEPGRPREHPGHYGDVPRGRYDGNRSRRDSYSRNNYGQSYGQNQSPGRRDYYSSPGRRDYHSQSPRRQQESNYSQSPRQPSYESRNQNNNRSAPPPPNSTKNMETNKQATTSTSSQHLNYQR